LQLVSSLNMGDPIKVSNTNNNKRITSSIA